MKPISFAVAIVTSVGLLCAAAAAEPTVKIRRFALIIGANDGGADRVKLRYATTDAASLGQVIGELGGVARSDTVLLLDPDRAGLDAAFRDVRARLEAARAPSVRIELLVYYSGHSDEEGLLVSGQRYSYPELRRRIAEMPSDVNIAILDSCASGSFTRLKGGTKQPAFLVDESTQVRGYAFLSSSSADEAAQESDKIAASFFTHYLVSGLRGGADANHDRKVTLNEAYQFAFSETVARTEATQAGPQHPAYDMHLVGSGDVVMTDLRATSAALVVAADVAGRLFVRDEAGRLVVEISKPEGREVVLGLGPERYQVTLQSGDRLLAATVILATGQRTNLALGQFTAVEGEATVVRGGPPGAVDYDRVPVSVALVPSLGVGGQRTIKHFSINLLVGRAAILYGFEVGGLVNLESEDVTGLQIAGLGNLASGDSKGILIAGLGNRVGGRAEGFLVGGLGNQIGGDQRGIAIGGLGNASRALTGAQIAGLGNLATGKVTGLQIGGLSNHAAGIDGVQIAGGANVSRGDVEGVQIAVVNVGGAVRGAQIGVVNVARRVDGAQIGVVNLSDQASGVPIGLLSLSHGGHRALEAWASDLAPINVGFKIGSRYFYTLGAVGSDRDQYFAGLGLGLHLPRHSHYFDADVISWARLQHDLRGRPEELLSQARIGVGFPVTADLAVFAGGALTTHVILERQPDDPCERCVIHLEPGFFAGLSYQ